MYLNNEQENNLFETNFVQKQNIAENLRVNKIENESSLIEPTIQKNILISKKKGKQFQALFFKSASLQSKQIGTNLCQIITPLICLTLILIIQKFVSNFFENKKSLTIETPIPFNVPGLNDWLSTDFLPVKITNCIQWYLYGFDKNATLDTINYVGFYDLISNQSDGLLSNILSNYMCGFKKRRKTFDYKIVPFFKKTKNILDINDHIFNELNILNNLKYIREKDIFVLPDGAIKFYEANDKKLSFTLQINDLRMKEYHRNNFITKISFQSTSKNLKKNKYETPTLIVPEGQLSFLDLITKAFIHKKNPKYWTVSGVQYMPFQNQEGSFLSKIINLSGSSLFPLSLSLLLPVFMYAIVLEKEERLLEMMKMNGMRMRIYWLVAYIFDFLLYLIMAIIFLLFGFFILDLSFFQETSIILLILSLVGWGLSQVSLAIFFQVFISKARTSTIIGYLLSIWTIIIAVSLNVGVYPEPFVLPFGFRLYPPIGFCRIIYKLSIGCSNDTCYTSIYQINDEIKDCIMFLYIGALFFLILGMYLHEIIPQEYGVSKSPLFPFQKIYSFFFRKNKIITKDLSNQKNESSVSFLNFEQENDYNDEDNDSRNERERVYSLNKENYNEYPLICKNLQKIYITEKQETKAVKNLSLIIENGEIFGLLGPNGAGKTTLISMITGMYPPNNGDAYIGGYSIKNNMDQVHLQMGVCPQFDLLWPDLTIEEHLKFYARMRGVPSKLINLKVKSAIKEVFLQEFSQFQSKKLSGGMKRRLSVSIALVGDPKIIFLDEPTTGLDPENRRQLWDIISNIKGKRAIFLTTHSMEEADVLCSRIGIINNGVLKCVGTQIRLKSLYGGGYHLYINCKKEKYSKQNIKIQKNTNILMLKKYFFLSKITFLFSEDNCVEKNDECFNLTQFIKNLLPESSLISNFNGNFIFQVPFEGVKLKKFFQEIEFKKKEFLITDWGFSQSSLENVFMKVVK